MPQLTATIVAELCKVARGGLSLEGCARWVRVTPDDLRHWLTRGAALADEPVVSGAEQLVAKLFREFSRAMAEREAEAVLAVGSGKKGWQSQAWFLERTQPERYGTKEAHRVEEAVLADTGYIERLRAAAAEPEDAAPAVVRYDVDSTPFSPHLRRSCVRDLPVGEDA